MTVQRSGRAVKRRLAHDSLHVGRSLAWRHPLAAACPEVSVHIFTAPASPFFPTDKRENGEVYQRKKLAATDFPEGAAPSGPVHGNSGQPGVSSWRRIALLILAITIHNIPGKD